MNVGKKIHRIRLICILCILCMVVSLSPTTVFANSDNVTNAGKETALKEGEMRLKKVAEPVEGEVNSWKVTVTAESKDAQRPKDYILVIDRSGSMLYDENNTKNKTEMPNSRIVYAREAAKELVEGVYAADDRNRVAVLSFSGASSGTVDTKTGYFPEGSEHTSLDIGLSGKSDQSDVYQAIDDLKGSRITGGTYTQLALHQAQELMANAHQEADGEERDRVIILVTDGRPTITTEVDWNQVSADQFKEVNIGANDCQTYRQTRFTSGDNKGKPIYIDADTGKNTPNQVSASGKQNTPKMAVQYADAVDNVLTNGTNIPKAAFDYENAITNTIGYGANTPYATSDNTYGQEAVYANMMNLTIAEANNIRAEKDVQGIFVVGYDVSDDDAEAIQEIAGDSNHYVNAKGENGIKKAMETILKKTSATKFSAMVSDQIPVGFSDPEDIQASCGTATFKNGVIDWSFDTPDKEKENQDPNEAIERTATLSYVLRVKDSDTFVADKFFETNGETKVTYDNPLYPGDPEKEKTVTVESPQVKVCKYTIKKKVMNDSADDSVFTIHVISPSGKVKALSLKNNGEKTVTDFFETGNYKVKEIVDSKGYSVKYLIDGVETDTFSMKTLPIDQSKIVNIEIQNTKKDYNVGYRFEAMDPNDTLPEEVMALLPTGQTGVLNKTSVTAEQPQTLEVTVGADTWVFKGYDKNTKTIDGADIEFVGTWAKIHTPPYKATYEYVSGTPGKELPDTIKNLTPKDVTEKDTGDTVEAEQPAQTEVTVEGGKWVFEGYDKDSVTFTNTDEKFTGTWKFIEDPVFQVTYDYVSGTPGKELPEEVKNLTPEAITGLPNGATANATKPSKTEVAVKGGKWIFQSYDKNSVTIDNADEQFIGTWVFEKEAPKTANMVFSGTKTLTENGKDKDIKAGQFKFEVREDADNPAKIGGLPEDAIKVAADGSFSLGKLTFDKEGTYKLTVSEVNGGAAGYTYDDKPVIVTIPVTLDEDANAYQIGTVSYQKDGAKVDGIMFTNTYEAPKSVVVTLTGTKTFTENGKKIAMKDGQFKFRVEASEDNPEKIEGLSGDEIPVRADGSIDFGKLGFSQAGTYRLTVSETDEGLKNVTYDDKAVTVTVRVSLNTDTNKLEADKISYRKDGKEVQGIEFENTYKSPKTVTTVTKVTKTKTGDPVNMALLIVLMFLSVGVVIGVAERRRKQ